MPEGAGAPAARIDALTLLRLVRARRELALVWRLALLGCLVWAALVLTIERATTEGSALWNRVDADAGPGFVALLVVFALALGAQVALRFAGPAGRVAEQLVPVVAPAAEPSAADAPPAVAGLLAQLRRKPLVSIAAIAAAIVLGFLAFAAVAEVVPAYGANHGRGGHVVTVGRDGVRVITGSRVVSVYRGWTTVPTYALVTPYGDAGVVGDRPETGQRWTVRSTLGATPEAYRVGAHDYVLVGAVAVVFVLGELGLVIGTALVTRRRWRQRAAADGPSLGTAVDALGRGTTVDLVVGGRPVRLALMTSPGADAEDILRRWRWRGVGAAGGAAVVLAGAAAAGIAIASPAAQGSPSGTVRVAALAGTTWSALVEPSRTPNPAMISLMTTALRDGGVVGAAEVELPGSVVIRSTRPADLYAEAYPFRVGSADPGRAVAGVAALERSLAGPASASVTALTMLPSGWQGIVAGPADGQPARAVATAAVPGRLLWLEIDQLASARPLGTAALAGRMRELASALAREGIAAFAGETTGR